MDIDLALRTMQNHSVHFLLIGGMNFLLKYQGELTYDIDLWIEDTPENRAACEEALAELNAEWGKTEQDWGPVAEKPKGWIASQGVFSLLSDAGAIDIFRAVSGLDDWNASYQDAQPGVTAGGVNYQGLSDRDMLRCQLALESGVQKESRVKRLREELGEKET